MKSFNICIVRPSGYLWSSVFSELAELLEFSIQDLGYTAKTTENFIDPSSRNIIVGCHLADDEFFIKTPPNSIIFNTEQIGAGPAQWNQNIVRFVEKFETWDYSKMNIEKFISMGLPSPKYFKFGFHRKLERINKSPNQDIDVLFYGSMNKSRLNIIEMLKKNGLNVLHLFGVFGNERDAFISRSKIILNMHQHNTKDFEIIRTHYLMNNSKTIVSQFDSDSCIDPDYRDGIIFSNYNKLVDACMYVAKSKTLIKIFEEKSLKTIKKFYSNDIVCDLLNASNHQQVARE